MLKTTFALLVAATEAVGSNSPVLNSSENSSEPNLIATDPTTTTITAPTTTTNTTSMVGAWTQVEQLATKTDIALFESWQPIIKTFLGGTTYPQMTVVNFQKQLVNGTNFRVTYNVSPLGANQAKYSELVVVVFQPRQLAGVTTQPDQVMSVTLPTGVRHISAITHSDDTTDVPCGTLLGGVSCWKTTIDSDNMTMFKGFQTIIEDFHGNKDYGTDFTPIKYKTQVMQGVIYTIQYKTAAGNVQATIYKPLINVAGKVQKVERPAEVTQFVDEKGNVKGAYKLGASIMMMASLIASVALA